MSDKREDTFVAGLSMGGYGAFKVALSAPETFGAAASLSGALDLPGMVGLQTPASLPYWQGIFGDPAAIAGSDHDLLHLAEKCRENGTLPRLYSWCGTEDFLYKGNLNFNASLAKLGIELEFHQCSGDHSWPHWDREIQPILDWLLAGRE